MNDAFKGLIFLVAAISLSVQWGFSVYAGANIDNPAITLNLGGTLILSLVGCTIIRYFLFDVFFGCKMISERKDYVEAEIAHFIVTIGLFFVVSGL